MNKATNLFKKLHKWPGLIAAFVLLYYSLTGIILNHRELFSGFDINRKYLPDNYTYTNWNNAALKGNINLSPNLIWVYGNIGVWQTDPTFKEYTPKNAGFPAGSDNLKVADVHQTPDGSVYAATMFGLYIFDATTNQWQKMDMGNNNERIVAIESIGDTLYVANRSYLYKGLSKGFQTQLERIQLDVPDGYENKVSLFATVWQIHSGEIFGLPGKIFVDLLGLITVLLSLTGIVYFIAPGLIRRRKKHMKPVEQLVGVNRWSLKWHNKTGAYTFILLILLFFTGMFLRPPLLIAIARAKVSPVPFSHLDQPNPWYDKLRDILYDKEKNIFLLSTSDGMYSFKPNLHKPERFAIQPPVSVMGINTLKPFSDGAYIVGSFSGLFVWHPGYTEIFDYAEGKMYNENSTGRPVGNYKVSGTITLPDGKLYMVDYDKGIVGITARNDFPAMPASISNSSGMSLWNVCLEIHTGRFFQGIIGNFYIFIVPLTGLLALMVVVSGYLLWRKKYRKTFLDENCSYDSGH